MEIRPIRNELDHAGALRQIERLWGAKPGSKQGDRLEVFLTLVDAYEREAQPIDAPDPIEAIRFRMDQLGLSRKDLEPFIGSRGRVSEVLNRKRGLSLEMIRRLHDGLKLPYESLIS